MYDNRHPSSPYYIEIDTSGTKWTGRLVKGTNSFETIVSCKFENNFDVYNIMDVDGFGNDAPNEAAFEDYCLLEVCSTGAFTIENSENEMITCDGNGVTGDMDIYRQNFLPSGEDAPVVYFFVVPNSDSFTCTVEDDASIETFSVTAETGWAGITADDFPDDTIQGVVISNISTEPVASTVQ